MAVSKVTARLLSVAADFPGVGGNFTVTVTRLAVRLLPAAADFPGVGGSLAIVLTKLDSTITERQTLFASPHLLEAVVIIRQAAGSRNSKGRWIPGSEIRIEVNAVTSPADRGTWRHVLTAGVRLADHRQFRLPAYVGPIAPVRVGAGQTQGDVIEYKGTLYRVRDVQDWTVAPMGYAASGSIVALGERADGQ